MPPRPRARCTASCCGAIPASYVGSSERSTEYALLGSGRTRGCARPAGARAARTGRRARRRVPDGPHRRRDDPAPHPARRRVRGRAPAAGGAVRRRSRRASTNSTGHGAAAAAAPGRRAADSTQYRDLLDQFDEPHPTFELGLRWLDGAHPAGARPADARARRLPQRQLHRRRRKASAPCSTGSSPTSATRSRTSAGCA